jgi:indolepyruvate decarboxylase
MATLGKYIVDSLARAGVKHGFHIPGDYTLPMYKHFKDSGIELVGTTTERAAGIAADAYARVNGIGLCMVTYCVGGFNALDAIAGAFAEKSPVVIISGSPGIKERKEGMLLHHMVRSFECQHEIYANVTCANTVLRDPARAGYEIDRVLNALKTYSRPVYIEIPRDMMDRPIAYALDQGNPATSDSDDEVLQEVLDEISEYINSSKNPVILAGEEIARYGMLDRLKKLAEKTNIPVATSLLGKGVFSERHPLSLGVYSGSDMSRPEVAKAVDDSDCLIMLGVMQTDFNLGFIPLKIGKRKIVLATSESCQIRNSFYKGIRFPELIEGLLVSNILPRSTIPAIIEERDQPTFDAKPEAKLTVARFFKKIDSVLASNNVVLADIGDSLLGASDLTMHNSMQFLSPAFYTSMGFAVPGCLGVMKARPDCKPLVFVGDGAFQMTGMEISTLVRNGLAPKIFVLNNGGYQTERMLMEGTFNDIQNWNFEKITDVVGGGKGYVVETEGDLEKVLNEALPNKQLCIINVKLGKGDISPALARLTSKLKKRV